jgi:hypothetical protein
MKWNISKEEFKDFIKNSNTKSEVLRKLNLKMHGGNYNTLNRYIEIYNIDISHFKENFNNYKNFIKRDLSEILVEKSTFTSSSHLKNRLYKEGLKERICEMCGQTEEWNGNKISLILDHINGIRNDNRIENLRILCPNCNATLDTHCGKNKKKKKQIIINNRKNKIEKYCSCGKKIHNSSNKCIQCFNKIHNIRQRKVERPSYDQLLKEIKELGYRGTGRKYGVSDNSIRKWKKFYEKIN